MAQPFDAAKDVVSRQRLAIIESTIVAGQPVHAVSGPGGGAVPVSISGSVTTLVPNNDQISIAITNTAVALTPATFQVDLVHVIANLTNGGNIFLGDSGVDSTNGLILEPGRGVTLENTDLNRIFINGTAGDGVSFVSLT